MRSQILGRIFLVSLGGLAGVATMALTRGQVPPAPKELPPSITANDPKGMTPPTLRPATNTTPLPKLASPTVKARVTVPYDRFRNLDSLPEQTKQNVVTALTGVEWLYRYNQPNGLFLPGYLPAVNQPMEGEHFLHQALATFTLTRAARFTGDDRYGVRANQAILTLLSGTTVDGGMRRPAQPSIVCNRLAAAAYLVMSICELPEPAADLLGKAEELAVFIGKQQRADGTFSYVDSPNEDPLTGDPDGINQYPGPAMYALAMSNRVKPAAWKMDVVRKAAVAYRKWFKEHAHADMVPWMTAACAEGYLATKENAFAEFAFEMNDWLCGLQYTETPDPRRPLWRGGFKPSGKSNSQAPGIEAALYAQSLADCCRMIRQMPTPDVNRYDRHRAALLRALQFVSTLQFTEANTLHIAANYRFMLIGGFHPTHLDGNLRIDQGASGTGAFLQFLTNGLDKDK